MKTVQLTEEEAKAIRPQIEDLLGLYHRALDAWEGQPNDERRTQGEASCKLKISALDKLRVASL